MNWFDVLAQAFTMPFMVRAAIVLGALTLAAGVIGVFVNLRGLEFMTDGLTHAVFPGIAAGFALAGNGGLFVGAAIAAALATVVLTILTHRNLTSDTAVAIILTAMFSIGVVFVSRSRHATGSLEQLLFGHLFTISPLEMWLTVGVCLVALVMVLVTVRGQLFAAFDASGAKAAGYGALIHTLVLNVAIACVVVAASIAIGNLLVLAVLVIPGGVSRMWARGLIGIFTGALIFAIVMSLAGLLGAFTVSVGLDVAIPGGAAIAVVLVAGYLLSLLIRTIIRPRARGGVS